MKLYFCYHNVTIKYIKSLTKNIFDRERPIFHESRLGKWIDNEAYEFIYASESFITTSIFIRCNKNWRSIAMVCLSLMLVVYLMLKRYKIEALFLLSQCHYHNIKSLTKKYFDRERPIITV